MANSYSSAKRFYTGVDVNKKIPFSNFYYGVLLGYTHYRSEIFHLLSKTNVLGIGPQLQYAQPIGKRWTISLAWQSQLLLGKHTVESNGEPEGLVLGLGVISARDKTQYFTTGLQSSVRFDVLKNIGLSLNFAGVSYNKSLNIGHNYSEFNFNYKPKNWLLGAYIRF